MKKKRADIFSHLFLLVHCLLFACSADSSTCTTPSESDFNDTSNHCQILFDLKNGPLFVRPNQPLCVCAVGSRTCVDGIPVINNVHAYGGSFSNTRTPHKELLKTCLVWHNVTPSDNGSLIFIRLVGPEGSLYNPLTATTELVVLDPPTNPGDGEVTIICSTGAISWTRSAGADYYVLNLHCGENHILKDIQVDGTTYTLNYSLNLRNHCEASVYAVNLAGKSSVYSFATVLAEDPQYTFYEYGIVISGSHAYLYLNMTGNKFCLFSYPKFLNVCVTRDIPLSDTKCVVIPVDDPNNVKFTSWLYQEVKELPLLLHTHYIVNIEACNDASCKKFNKILNMSTHHIQQAGSCYDNGSCSLYCVLTRGSQVEGCTFIFHRMNDNKTLPRVNVAAGEVQEYVLEPGDYMIYVYGWDSGNIPAIIMQISVINKDDVTLIDEGSIIGMSVGSFFGLCVIFVGLIFIIVGALLYYRRRRAQYDVEHGTSVNENRNVTAETAFDGSVDLKQLPIQQDQLTSTPLPVMSEETTEAGTQGEERSRVEDESLAETTSQCASDAPLLDKSQPSGTTPNQFRDLYGYKKVPGPPKPHVTVVVSNTSYKYANRTEECGGLSTETGQPVVAPEDNGSSCIHLGGGVVRSYRPSTDVEEEFTPAAPRNAQTSMGTNSAVVTSNKTGQP